MTTTRTGFGALLAAASVASTLIAGSAYAQGWRDSPSPAPTYSASAAHGFRPSPPSLRSDGSTPLGALLREWDRAGFSAPSKPLQYRVVGRNGYETSGPGYNAIAALMRSAIRDTREGRDEAALLAISKARRLLDQAGARAHLSAALQPGSEGLG